MEIIYLKIKLFSISISANRQAIITFPMLKHNSMLHGFPPVRCHLFFYGVRMKWEPWPQRSPET